MVRLFEHMRNGHFEPSDLVTHHVPLEHIAEGFHMTSQAPARWNRDELRARIPGCRADLDVADRPSAPRERSDPALAGAQLRAP